MTRPLGTVTFLFTDVEGSTRRWEDDPGSMGNALARHDAILREVIERRDGYVFATGGDGFAVAFGRAGDAVAAAVEMQVALTAEDLPSVRMGMHTGEAQERDDDYFGPSVNRAARLMALAHGGQVVVSRATEAIVREALPAHVDLVDLGQHRLSDLSGAEQVFQVVLPELRREFPPLRSVGPVLGNLPVQVTSFLGREVESARIGAVMEQARVVTLTGVGGVGKTRLALRVAETASASAGFPDGCWVCELAPVRDPELVPDAVIGALGVQPRPGVKVLESLLAFLRAKELLLVLDNCEHLLQPVAQLVARVEQTCPGVQIVATSREGLNVAGEWIVAVSSLPVADAGADLEAIAGCDAVCLFVERARAARQDFRLDHNNSDSVAQICRRVDGIPLAIELAAARVGALSPSELAARLDDRFRVLGGGHRGAVERHQTLRAAIDWSYNLLTEAERRVLERLSVFAGGFALVAAEAVASGDGIDGHAVLDALVALVAQSLVIADTDGSDTRYRLYETIRQYAYEQLADSGDANRVRDRHARYFAKSIEAIAVARSADYDLYRWDDDLDREADNLHAAFIWAVDTQDVDAALRMLVSIPSQWMPWGALAFRTAADTAVTLPGASQHSSLPRALSVAAMYANARGDQDLAVRHCADAVAAEERLGTDADWRIWTVQSLVAMTRGALDEYVECCDRVVALQRARNDLAGLAIALSNSAWARTFVGDPASAAGDATEAVAFARRDARPAVVEQVLMLAAHALADTQPERALALLNEAIDLHETLGRTDAWSDAGISAIAGHLASRLGNRSAGLRHFALAIRQYQHVGWVPILGPLLRSAGDLLVPDDPETAAILHGAGDTPFPSPHRADQHEQATAALDAILGAARRTELNDQGKAMDVDDAVALAFGAIDQTAGTDDGLGPITPWFSAPTPHRRTSD